METFASALKLKLQAQMWVHIKAALRGGYCVADIVKIAQTAGPYRPPLGAVNPSNILAASFFPLMHVIATASFAQVAGQFRG